MGQGGTCRSCSAPVIWVVTEAGKRMPLDATPERRFVLDQRAEVASARDTYTSHFATCPNADRWRKK